MAGEWGRVSRRCQWASGGGTCPMALLQVTLLAWRLGQDGPRDPVQPGRCGGCERWLLPWCLDRAEGSWDLPTAAGAVGQGCGAGHAWQLCHAGSKLLAVLLSNPREGGQGRERCGMGALRCLSCPTLLVPGCPAALRNPFPVSPSRLLHWQSTSLESSSLCVCVCRPASCFPVLLWPHS